MNPHQIKRLFPRASASTLAANSHHYGQNTADLTQSPKLPLADENRDEVAPDCAKLERSPGAGALGKGKAKKGDSRRFLVRVQSVRRRLIDEDNLCEKYAVDCCRYAGLLPGDGPQQTKIEVSQRKAEKGEEEHTLIEIYQFAQVHPSLGQVTHSPSIGEACCE